MNNDYAAEVAKLTAEVERLRVEINTHDAVVAECHRALEKAGIAARPDGSGQPNELLPDIVKQCLTLILDLLSTTRSEVAYRGITAEDLWDMKEYATREWTRWYHEAKRVNEELAHTKEKLARASGIVVGSRFAGAPNHLNHKGAHP